MHPTVALRCNKTSTETNPLLDAIRRSSFSQCCFGYTMCSENLVGNSQTSHCQLFSLLSWGGGGGLDGVLLSAVTARQRVGVWRRGLIIMTLKDRAGLASIRCWLFVSVCVFAVMLHGLPISKVKRESSPSKELSPCRKLQADMCLYSYRYKKKK